MAIANVEIMYDKGSGFWEQMVPEWNEKDELRFKELELKKKKERERRLNL